MKYFFKAISFGLLLHMSIFMTYGQEKINVTTLIRYELDSIDGVYIPYDISDSFKQIDSFWSNSLKKEVKKMSENEFVANAHMGFGMWIRNNWGLWGGSRLSNYFNKFEIFHPDDMSGIILTSYYRHLFKKEINFEEQILHYKNYWKKVDSDYQTIEQTDSKSEITEETLYECRKEKNICYNYPYGFSSEQEEEYCTANNYFATGKILEIDSGSQLIKIKLIKCYSPHGVIIYDTAYGILRYIDEEYDDNGKISPKKGRSIFYMKEGDEFWFSDKDDYWDWECEP